MKRVAQTQRLVPAGASEAARAQEAVPLGPGEVNLVPAATVVANAVVDRRYFSALAIRSFERNKILTKRQFS